MYRRGRPLAQEFAEEEPLYLRYGCEDFAENQLQYSAVRFPQMSVNRGRFSEPEDVLFSEEGKFDGLGVLELRVADIPKRLEQDNGPAYVFFMHHAPLEDNYAHSEICSARDPETASPRSPSATVKTKFLIMLCQRITRDRIRIEAVRDLHGGGP